MSSWPALLPNPISLSLDPKDRSIRDALPGKRNERTLQQDLAGTLTLDFVMTFEQLGIFRDFCETDKAAHGAWFNTRWPSPMGTTYVVKFLEYPSRPTYYPQFGWHVSVVAELRGRGSVQA